VGGRNILAFPYTEVANPKMLEMFNSRGKR
jgi:hypothetical protein